MKQSIGNRKQKTNLRQSDSSVTRILTVCRLFFCHFVCTKTKSMAAKRKGDVPVPAEESDLLTIRPL